MAKALSQSDVVHELERWASAKKRLEKLEAEQAAEIEPFAAEFEAKCAEITKSYEKKIDKLTSEVDERETKVTGWLNTKKKTTTVDSKHAVAEIVHGTKLGNRIPDLKKLFTLCSKKGVDFFAHIVVMLGSLDKALGKAEVDAISTRESVPTKVVTLKLK